MCKSEILNKKCTEVDEAFCKMEQDFNSLMTTIDAFNGLTNKPINKKDLESFPLNKWIDLGGGIKVRKRNNRFNTYLNFDTTMEMGSEFGTHFHNDIIESCEVVEGLMYDTITKKYYKKGDVAHFDKGQKHEPIAIEETFLHVLFKP